MPHSRVTPSVPVFIRSILPSFFFFFFFNDTATTEIYTLSLHDALPISTREIGGVDVQVAGVPGAADDRQVIVVQVQPRTDRKSTRLNSSHANISYAVFCLKKKKNTNRRLLASEC